MAIIKARYYFYIFGQFTTSLGKKGIPPSRDGKFQELEYTSLWFLGLLVSSCLGPVAVVFHINLCFPIGAERKEKSSEAVILQ